MGELCLLNHCTNCPQLETEKIHQAETKCVGGEGTQSLPGKGVWADLLLSSCGSETAIPMACSKMFDIAKEVRAHGRDKSVTRTAANPALSARP